MNKNIQGKKLTMNTLKKLIHLGEGYRLELKESLDKSFVEEVCAFANSGGGKIILGVSDKGMIKGINTDNSFRSRVQDTIKLEPKLDVTIAVVGNLIVVDVPEGAEKPYACSKGFFVRIGPNTQKLSRNEIVSLFQKEGRIRFDEIENRKADLERDFDETAFQKFLQFASITPSIDRTFLLRNLDCINENNKLTNAGVLFFCKSTEFLLFHATVVCVLYKGNQKLHILDKKDFMGNIVDNINNAMTFVNRHTNLIYKIDSLRRTEIPEIPEVALRESIVNAVCHRDYFQKGANVMIEIFDDCVSITNPGGLPADLKPSEFGSKSVVRNAVIASLLHRIDYIEKIGTGINRIKNAVREHGQCNVSFSFDTFFTVTFRRNIKNKHLIGDNTITKVGDNSNKVGDSSNKVGDNSIKVGDSSNKVGDNSIKVGDNLLEKVGDRLTKNQYAILACIRDNNRVSARQLSKKVGISQRKIEENIVKLRNKKIIKRIGSPRGGHWEVFLS